MMILALEFSSPQRSVALVRRPAEGIEPLEVLGMVTDEGGRAVQPLTLIDSLLSLVEVPRNAVNAVVVGLGPGSYTGIRSAIAVAQGWQLGRDVRLAGVSSMECLALQAQANGWFGSVNFVVDAQRKEVYVAAYQIGPVQRELLAPLCLIPVLELGSLAKVDNSLCVGPEVTRWCSDGRTLFPRADALARLATFDVSGVAGESLEPIYLRETAFVKAPQPRKLPD